jgi:hypothetical protein
MITKSKFELKIFELFLSFRVVEIFDDVIVHNQNFPSSEKFFPSQTKVFLFEYNQNSLSQLIFRDPGQIIKIFLHPVSKGG